MNYEMFYRLVMLICGSITTIVGIVGTYYGIKYKNWTIESKACLFFGTIAFLQGVGYLATNF